MNVSVMHFFSLHQGFFLVGFSSKVYNEAVLTNFLKFHNGHSRGSIVRKCMNDNQFTKGMFATFVK